MEQGLFTGVKIIKGGGAPMRRGSLYAESPNLIQLVQLSANYCQQLEILLPSSSRPETINSIGHLQMENLLDPVNEHLPLLFGGPFIPINATERCDGSQSSGHWGFLYKLICSSSF